MDTQLVPIGELLPVKLEIEEGANGQASPNRSTPVNPARAEEEQ
jgi:hypothetical protein